MDTARPQYLCECLKPAKWFFLAGDAAAFPRASFAACDRHLAKALRYMRDKCGENPVIIRPVNQ